MNGMTNAINLTAILIATISMITSLIAIILVLAQKFSTHKIEWKPLVTNEETYADEAEDVSTSDEDFLAEAVSLQNKKKKKEVDPLSELETNNF